MVVPSEVYRNISRCQASFLDTVSSSVLVTLNDEPFHRTGDSSLFVLSTLTWNESSDQDAPQSLLLIVRFHFLFRW